jgi:hypothetical protein
MSTHLPYAYSPENEFLHPSEGWLLLERSVAYDSWISWRHVLPAGMRDCRLLTTEISEAIVALAQGIHQVHELVPGYRHLDKSPFRVLRWWDPFGGHPWNSGRICTFEVDGCRPAEFVGCQPGGSPIRLRQLTATRLRASLNPAPAAGPGSRPACPDVAPRPGTAAPQAPPSPPPGTPGRGKPPGPPAA